MSENTSTDERNIAMLAHLLGILTAFIGCLIIWLINKDKPEKPFVIDQSREALNFQITVFLVFVVVGIALAIVGMIPVLGLIVLFLGPLLFLVVGIANLVFCIIAGIAASNGKDYRYPIALRLIK